MNSINVQHILQRGGHYLGLQVVQEGLGIVKLNGTSLRS